MFRKLLENHILTNLTFLLVLMVGAIAYYELPREQDPSVNFNWVQILAYWPGASATDVKNQITEPLEDGIDNVPDIRFVSSTSRQGISSILVRFTDLKQNDFDKRMTDLRREVQAKQDELPNDVDQPEIFEITSSNAFATATLVVWSRSHGEALQAAARNIKEDLLRLEGIDSIDSAGDLTSEIQVNFLPYRLLGLGVSPVDLANTVTAYFRDLAAGSVTLGDQKWLVRLAGTSSDPMYLEQFPIVTAQGELPLRSVANVVRGRERPQELVRYDGHPAIMFSIFKKNRENNLDLLKKISNYLAERNRVSSSTGIELVLLDDQTEATRSAIQVMERNALIGLILVLLTTWLFLGAKIALVTSIGIPFVLAGTFVVLYLLDQTLNVTVLLGVVISLGMLVDDAVVVVEAVHFRMQQGMKGVAAAIAALREVAVPVSTAVLTTLAAFLPLMLLPGVLGDFMRTVPVVVTVALLVSLIEAFWMLPSHVIEFQPEISHLNRAQKIRKRAIRRLRRGYALALITTLRHPKPALGIALILALLPILSITAEMVRVDFFASDFFRLFYVNVEMPAGTSLEKTSKTLEEIEQIVKKKLEPKEARGVVNYAGVQFTDREVLFGDEAGQIFVSLNPGTIGSRSVLEIIDDMRSAVESIPGPKTVSFLRRKTGPPTSKPISIKVRGDDIQDIREAILTLKNIIARTPGTRDVNDDDREGGMELKLQPDLDAITRARLNPADVIRILRLFADGEIVSSMRHQGDTLGVRVRADPKKLQDIDAFLSYPVGLADGREVALGELLNHETQRTTSNIRRYNFRRTVMVEADLDTSVTDTLSANQHIQREWDIQALRFPRVSLEFSGELDDIKESMNAMAVLFLLGICLIYLILGTQFRSYLQPFIVLMAVPMAFIGVVLGLLFSGTPMSLFTLYGIIALAGIAANDAIVLISTANRNLYRGWSKPSAILFAARRRVVPILITSLTTMAGLFSLATGLGGTSLMWGPVATAIVWGLGFSTLLTLFLIPLAYHMIIKEQSTNSIALIAPEPIGSQSKVLRYRIASWVNALMPVQSEYKDKNFFIALGEPEVERIYSEGIDALKRKKFELAIRNFQQLAEERPMVKTFNILAAQAHISFMQKFGWDIGYIARAQRYLIRAKSIDADDDRLVPLEKAYIQLEESNKDGFT